MGKERFDSPAATYLNRYL